MDCRPEIKDVPLNSTIRVKALKGVLAEMDREGPLRVPSVAVHRTGTTTLLTPATQLRHQIQILEYLFHVDVFPQEQAMRIQQLALAVVGTASELPLREGYQLVRSQFKQAEPLEIASANHLLPVTKPRQVAEGLARSLARHPMA